MADADILIAVLVRVYMILIRNIDAGSDIETFLRMCHLTSANLQNAMLIHIITIRSGGIRKQVPFVI